MVNLLGKMLLCFVDKENMKGLNNIHHTDEKIKAFRAETLCKNKSDQVNEINGNKSKYISLTKVTSFEQGIIISI